MTLSDADLVRASRGITNPDVEVHVNPGHAERLRRVSDQTTRAVLTEIEPDLALLKTFLQGAAGAGIILEPGIEFLQERLTSMLAIGQAHLDSQTGI